MKEEFPFLFFYISHAVFKVILPANLLGMYLPVLMKPLIEFKLIPWLPGNPRHTHSLEKFIVYRFQLVEKPLLGVKISFDSSWLSAESPCLLPVYVRTHATGVQRARTDGWTDACTGPGGGLH